MDNQPTGAASPSPSSPPTVLVTGATGFLGANLVAGLNALGYPVRALHRRTSRFDGLEGLEYEPVLGDLLDPASLRAAMEGVDWVFHAAAVADYWRTPPEILYRVNVEGTRHVMAIALESGVRRVVFTSSVAALGVPPDDRPLNEEATFNLPPHRFPYGHSKHLAEQIVQVFVTRGLEAVIVNPAVIIGPRDHHFISGSLIRAVYRRQVPVAPPGGTNYVAVEDVVAGHLAAIQRGRPGERYILAGENLTYREMFRIVAEVVGVPPPRWTLPRPLVGPLALAVDLLNRVWPGHLPIDGNQIRLSGRFLYFDGSKARQELGLGPPTPFREAVRAAFQWYREHGDL